MMTKTFFAIIFIMTSHCINATKLPSFDTSNMPLNMYLGVENPIPIKLNGCNALDVIVKLDFGNIYKRTDSTYIVAVQDGIEEVKLKLYFKNILIESKVIKVLNIPILMGTVIFDIEKDNKISVSKIDQLSKLMLKYPDDYPTSMKHRISTFRITLNQQSFASNQILYIIQGDTLDSHAKDAMKTLKKGDIILLSNITTTNLSNQLHNLGSKAILITE